MRLIDADNIIGFGEYIKINEDFEPYIMIDDLGKLIDEQQTYYDVNNIVAELKEITDFIKYCTKYDKKNANKQEKSYRTFLYEFADLVDDLNEIVKEGVKNE